MHAGRQSNPICPFNPPLHHHSASPHLPLGRPVDLNRVCDAIVAGGHPLAAGKAFCAAQPLHHQLPAKAAARHQALPAQVGEAGVAQACR